MRTRSLLLSTALFGGILVAALTMHSGPVRAADVLRPQGTWTVSKVDARQPGAIPYCALTRRFTNGSVLTFARNPRQEGSLAIDTPDAGFKSGGEVSVALSAGSESRNFKATPVSERSVIVRMGEDGKFHQALEKSGELRVSIAGKTMAYALPDMVTGAQDLSACIGQSVEPAAGDSPKMAAMPAPAVEAQKAEKPAAVATGPDSDVERQKLAEENMRLRTALERERREFENRFQKTGENTSVTAELTEKLKLLEAENAALKSGTQNNAAKESAAAALVVCEPPKATPKEIKDTGAAALKDVSALKEENARLKATLDEQARRVAMLEEKNAQQKPSGMDEKSAKQIADLKEQIARLESDNKSLKMTVAQKEDAGADNLATLRQLKETQAQFQAAKAERDLLSAEIASIRKAEGDGRVSIASSNWNLEQATSRFNEAEREIRRLGSAVEQERAKCAVEKKNLEYMLFDPKIAEKEQISRLTTLEEQLAQAKQELENAGAGRQKTEAQEARIRELESRIADLSQRNASYETQMRSLEEKLAASGKQSATSEQSAMVDALRQEVSSLNAQIANIQSEKAAMALQLSRVQPAAGTHSARSVARADTTVSHVDVEVSGVAAPPLRENPVISPADRVAVPAVAAMAASNTRLIGAADVETLLRQSGVSVKDGVRKLDGASAADRVAYRWETQGLFGTAEQRAMESPAQFDRFVREYLDNTKSRCTGQFASVPALEDIQGGKRISAYEIACVDSEGAGASAALAFYSLDGKTFTTVAHEALPEAMDIAMDARDRIVTVLQGGKTASR